jgi:hypothetical protein
MKYKESNSRFVVFEVPNLFNSKMKSLSHLLKYKEY